MNQSTTQSVADASANAVKERFFNFIREFQIQDAVNYQDSLCSTTSLPGYYPDQITNMIKNDKTTVFVDFRHMTDYDPELAEAVMLEYYRFEPFLRKAVQEYIGIEHHDYVHDVDKGTREFFVSIFNLPNIQSIRSMHTDRIGRLIAISGTVTRSSEVRPELLLGTFSCRKCGSIHSFVEQQCQFTPPQVCRNHQCSSNDFQLILDQSAFVDWQRLRVQENADEIPAGSMPRCIDVICRNEVVESAKAGDKIVFTGTVLVVPDTSGLSRIGESTVSGKGPAGRGSDSGANASGISGLKRLGVKEMTYKMMFAACAVQHINQRTQPSAGGPGGLSQTYMGGCGEEDPNEISLAVNLTESEKNEILEMRNSPKLYSKMMESVCPSVFGHPEIKRGILLQLFGGVHKSTPDGISLRGDINVCIIGDPSTAKSQFLKYVRNFLARSVYTSGKASSAAGLTASVIKDSDTGEFCVEAGALMLADNGICCIDEFDKMDPSDQVAIHEAMEQQTISITKAGIQATLNARTSILAAANPVFGRYDRSKTLKANVAVSAPIMSRFDLFFVILDECNPSVDESIARHIIDVHRTGGAERASQAVPFSTDQLRRYIQFARTLNPSINDEGRKVLVECYRLLRQNDFLGKNKTAYRITVRQLESLIRLSEALARLHLDDLVRPIYIREAYRLLQQSIIFVEMEDIELDADEEVQDDSESVDGGDMEALDTAGDSSVSNMTTHVTERLSEVENASTANEESKRSRDPLSGDNEALRDAGDVEQSVKRARRDKSGKSKTMMSAELYRSMTAMIGLILKTKEEQHVLSGEDGDFDGCRWGDVVSWYLEQYQHEIPNAESFDEKRKLVSQVIRRMIRHEGAIIETRQHLTLDPSDTEEKYLKLHPSYEV